ncbi:DUF4199 family protein [Flavobacteriaceae bacterium R38]|nr:DUF4199 family protein [Flavobacteriaceae bacterium R38]
MKTQRIHIRYGLVVAIVLIAYFLIVKEFGLHENPWLRLLNGAIVAYGIYASIRFRRLVEKDQFNYLKGCMTGLLTGLIATLTFILFMAVYMFHIDPAFTEKILNNWMSDYYQGPGILLFILTIEGIASSLVLTLTFMQKFKPSWNTSKKATQKA